MLETILSFVGGIIVQGTGEIILYAVTLGRRKPSFLALPKERGSLTEGILSEVGFWVGLGFYATLVLLLALVLS